MNSAQRWLKAKKFTAHTIIFLGMVVTSGLMFFAASAGITVVVWFLLGVFVIANLFSLFV